MLAAHGLFGSTNRALAQCDSPTFGGTVSEVVPFRTSPLIGLADFTGDGVPDLVSTTGDDLILLRGDGTGRFDAPATFSVGYPKPPGISQPQFLLVADFNGDGKPDVAIAYLGGGFSSASGVAVLLGDGQGGFGSPSYSLVGTRTFELAAGDFNGDGKQDLVTLNDFGVNVLLGNGSGGFGAPLFTSVNPFQTGFSGLRRLGSGDFNEDGKRDLAVLTLGGLNILPGDGTGHFGAPLAVSFTGGRSVVLGDFNKDGHLDAAATDGDSNVARVYPGDGMGSFGSPTILPLTNASPIAALDLDGDGKLDLLVGRSSANEYFVSAFRGDGTGQFGPRVDYPAGAQPIAFAVGDLDLDGSPDLAVGTLAQAEVLHGNGLGGFRRASPTRIPASANINAAYVAIGDFNGDQKPDVVVSGTNNLSVFLGDGVGGLGSPILSAGFSGMTGPLVSGDFNGDLKQDVVAAFPGNPGNQFAVFLGNGMGGLEAPTYSQVPGSIVAIATADFNGDTKPDLAVTNNVLGTGMGNVSVYLGDGAGGFSPPTTYTLGEQVTLLTLADFNGDMRPDIAVITGQGGDPAVVVFLATGPGTFGPPTSLPLGLAQGSVVAGITARDFNGDGIPDLAVASIVSFDSAFVSVLPGRGAGDFGAPTTFATSIGLDGQLVSADFNGDGRLDLAGVAQGRVAVLPGTGNGSFLTPSGFIAGNDAVGLAVVDLNSDCKPDIVAVNALTHDLSLFPNSCAAMFPSTVIAARSAVCASSTGNTASVPDAGSGATYLWSITNGTITGGQGTRAITFSAGASGSVGLGIQVTDSKGCSSTGSASIPIASCNAGFYSVTPCRLVDTRGPAGNSGAPALEAGFSRRFSLAGQCGVSPTATAVAVNIVVVQPTDGPGFLTAYPAGTPRPLASTLNYSAGQIRANNAVVPLAGAGDVSVYCGQGSGSANVVIDVTGYFQ